MSAEINRMLSQSNPQLGRMLDEQERQKALQQQLAPTNYGGGGMGMFLTAASGAQKSLGAGASNLVNQVNGVQAPMGINERLGMQAEQARDKAEAEKLTSLQNSTRTASAIINGYVKEGKISPKQGAVLINAAATKQMSLQEVNATAQSMIANAQSSADKILARQDKEDKEKEDARRWNLTYGMNLDSANQQSVLNGQAVKQNALALDAMNNKLNRDGELSISVEDVLSNIQGVTPTQKLLVSSMQPQEALIYLEKIEAKKRDQEFKATTLSNINERFFGDSFVSSNSTGKSNRYSAAISALNAAGLTQEAANMVEERKSVVDQQNTIEDREQSISEKWNNDTALKEKRSIVTAASTGLALIEQGGGLSELAAQVSFFKTIDPTSVVKETEIQMANTTTGLLDGLSAAVNKAGGQGILSAELSAQLKDFFTLTGSLAVESYNISLAEQKLQYAGRGLDVNFMFGDEVSLSSPIQNRPKDYTFNLNKLDQPVNVNVLKSIQGEYSTLAPDNISGLQNSYEQVKNNPEGVIALRAEAKKRFGFDALGYYLYNREGK